MTDILAADIGGTHLRLVRIQANGTITSQTKVQADFSRFISDSRTAAETHILDTIVHACEPMLAGNSIAAFGIGFPGFFIGDSGILAASPNLPQLHNFALSEQLGKRLGIKVAAQNDALCAAIGELHCGVGQGVRNLLHITLGTGVGGGLILDGRPYTGENGMAMEFGHLRIAYDGQARFCGCGGTGCVEAYASATAVADRYREKSGVTLDSAGVHAAAVNGDERAVQVIDDAGLYLGRALAETIKLMDIKIVSISGGLTGAWDIFYPSLIQEMDAQLINPLKGRIKVLRSSLNDRGGLLGAAELARRIQQP